MDALLPPSAAPDEPAPAHAFLQAARLPLALSYTRCLTAAEYLELSALPGSPLLQRVREVRLTPTLRRILVEFPDTLHLLALAPEGSADSTGVAPLWMRVAESCPRAELRFAGEGELPLVEQLLGDDTPFDLERLELPQLFLLDDEWHALAHWGPRPHAADALLDEWLAEHPTYELLAEGLAAIQAGEAVEPAALDAAQGQTLQAAWAALNLELMLQMRIWYNSGLDAEVCNELQNLLAGLRDERDENDTAGASSS